MHIAAAMGTPTVALFGPSGEHRSGDRGGRAARVVTSDRIRAVPCGLDGCGGGKVSECLTTLPVDSACTRRCSRCSTKPDAAPDAARAHPPALHAVRRRRALHRGARSKRCSSATCAISLYTREWPQTNLQLMEPHIVDPFYLGRPVARLGLRARRVPRDRHARSADLVQSHERLLVLRHLSRRRRRACGLARGAASRRVARSRAWRVAVEPVAPLRAAAWRGSSSRESRGCAPSSATRRWCATRSRRAFRPAGRSAARSSTTAVDSVAFHPGLREHRERLCARYKIPHARRRSVLLVGSGYERKGVATAHCGARGIAATGASHGRRPRHAPRHVREPRAHARRAADDRALRRPAGWTPSPYFGAARRRSSLPTLYDPFPNARARGYGVRPAGDHEHEVRAPRSSWRTHDAGLVCGSRDVSRARGAHARAARRRRRAAPGRERACGGRAADADRR